MTEQGGRNTVKISIIKELTDFLYVILETDKITPITRYKDRLFRRWLYGESGIEWIVATLERIDQDVRRIVLDGNSGKIRYPQGEVPHLKTNERLFIVVDIVYDETLEESYKRLCEVESTNEEVPKTN